MSPRKDDKLRNRVRSQAEDRCGYSIPAPSSGLNIFAGMKVATKSSALLDVDGLR
jgi:hypothetical protein